MRQWQGFEIVEQGVHVENKASENKPPLGTAFMSFRLPKLVRCLGILHGER